MVNGQGISVQLIWPTSCSNFGLLFLMVCFVFVWSSFIEAALSVITVYIKGAFWGIYSGIEIVEISQTIVRSRATLIPEWLENLHSDTVNWF